MKRIIRAEIERYRSSQIGAECVVYDTIDSTNNAAKLLAKNGAPHGAVVAANQQTAGKGRLGRSFYSPQSQGIYMTMILRPECSPECSMQITSAASVAVARAIEEVTGLYVQIKWVNDLIWNGKKLCGILTESALSPNGTLDYVVVGIGINISTNSFPSELSSKATSLSEAGCQDVDSNELIAEILKQFELIYQQLNTKEFVKEYKDRSCVLGKTVEVIRGRDCFKAQAVDIDENAFLIVEPSDGDKVVLSSGEISIKGNWA